MFAQSARGRPLIVLVHGRGMIGRDTAATRRLWVEGLSSGAKTLGGAVPFEANDVRVAWYADVLDPRSNAGCDYGAADPRARRDARTDPGIKVLASLAGGLFSAISSSADSEANDELRGLAADAAFLSDARKRCAAEQRLADVLALAKRDGRPVVLVAHSLGSIVAYDYLSSVRDSNVVQRLVTVGSPLGAPALRQLLMGGDSTDVLTAPAAVRDWINIRHVDDQLAAVLPIARDTLVAAPADEPDPHELVGYLRDSTTARAILNGWCVAFGGARPQGCIGLVPR
jgi:pimeloyl-ACP methyl ester carboxylesterase